MAVVTRQSVTTITPNAWKWVIAGIGLLAISALADALTPMHVLVAIALGLAGSGRMFRVVLDREGLSYRALWKDKRFRWDEVSDFKINTTRYGLFNVATTIAFTHAQAKSTMSGQLSRFLFGGTHSVPVHGIKSTALIALMLDYQQGRVPADTPLAAPQVARPVSERRAATKPAARPAGQPAAARVPAKPNPELRQDPLIQDSASRRRALRGGLLG